MHWNEEAEKEMNRMQEDGNRISPLQEKKGKKERKRERYGEISNKEMFVTTFFSFWDWKQKHCFSSCETDPWSLCIHPPLAPMRWQYCHHLECELSCWSESDKAPTPPDDPGRPFTQGHLPSPIADLLKIVYDNNFKLLEETYICKVKNGKVNLNCLWNLTPASFWIW